MKTGTARRAPAAEFPRIIESGNDNKSTLILFKKVNSYKTNKWRFFMNIT
ncbi:hypothetical protein ABE501_10700 [Comamonas testosteroni]